MRVSECIYLGLTWPYVWEVSVLRYMRQVEAVF